MSADALPITTPRFALALHDLPISSLYAKHAELSNQLAHLASSNAQLETYARVHDDRECYEALLENREVTKRVEERRETIVKEVRDFRGLPWRPVGEEGKVDGKVDGDAWRVQDGREDVRRVNGAGDGDVARGEGGHGVFL